MIIAALVAAFMSVSPLLTHPALPPLLAAPAVQNDTMDAQDSSLTYGPFGQVWRVPMQRREIALTFDDGPYPFYTPLLLHVLERSRVPATFFLVGRSEQEFPELVQRLVAGGNEVGNHTFNHYTLTTLNDYQIAYQIAAGGAFLRQLTHRPVTLFRPPHGRYNQRVVAIAQQLGYHTIFWSDSPDDVKPISPDLVVARVLYQARPGAIVLMHSGQYKTIEALPVIIDRLRQAGYTFVTVSQLMNDGYYERPL